ncbi:prepilin-type N-terminal cleavage/methylation domain-containing protein [uncultured Vibrio sp.]|uniref:type IV pilus modification PilV family protein n=1 Tax=uncultured Vibrio sp. TaxID=114054 RepID=UPI000921ABAA|nr:prepilin-type N-terminal cleavage/methylation domain-containing protein [uncultured Vibrio sp.]OIQ26038.1 MAG: prepilin-type N-terminal cleavage/methylation domain-containing protein [Vibrio sp. MedPE-SWchi]
MIANQKGFSLIEVMVAFILIGVASLGLIKLQSYVESKADHAKTSLEALYMMESQLEKFRQRGVSSPAYLYTLLDVHGECNAMTENSSALVVQLACESELLMGDTVSKITVKAYWHDRYQQDKEVKIVTMLSKYSEFD